MRAIYLSLWLLSLGTASLAETPKVMVDISPVHALVSMVMGETGAPGLLLQKGADPHDFQLRPSQAQELEAADLVIWVGPEMSPWLGRTLDGLGRGTGLALLDAPQTLTRSFTEAAEEVHDHEADDHAHEGLDPHAWLDPENARIWLGLIADALAQADPAQAAVYRSNADAAQARVTEIETEVTALLAPVAKRPFAVTHDAYGYFAAHFGLEVIGSLRMGDAAPPGAAHVAELEDALKSQGAICLFTEANHNDTSARQMAAATGIRLGAPLDPEGSMLTPGAAVYGELMLGLAKSISDCLSAQ